MTTTKKLGKATFVDRRKKKRLNVFETELPYMDRDLFEPFTNIGIGQAPTKSNPRSKGFR